MMMKLSIKEAKAGFFDRDAVIDQVDKTAAQGASRWGAFVRRTARTSIRKARRKTMAELTTDERQRFRIYESLNRRGELHGQSKPKLPLASSKPGEPPRSIRGDLKQFLFFAYDPERRSVVVGPAKLNGKQGNAPQVLEEGGYAVTHRGERVRIEERPYMDPAFDKNIHALPRMLALGK